MMLGAADTALALIRDRRFGCRDWMTGYSYLTRRSWNWTLPSAISGQYLKPSRLESRNISVSNAAFLDQITRQ